MKRLAGFLIGVRESLCEDNEDSTPNLAELHRIIQRLMEAIFTGQDQDLKVALGGLEHEARLCKQEIERRLGVRI